MQVKLLNPSFCKCYEYTYCPGAGDIFLTNARIRLFPQVPIQSVTFTLTVDAISQEINETFIISFLSLPLSDSSLFPTAPANIGRLDGTIIDADCKLPSLLISLAFVFLLLQLSLLDLQRVTTDKSRNPIL